MAKCAVDEGRPVLLEYHMSTTSSLLVFHVVLTRPHSISDHGTNYHTLGEVQRMRSTHEPCRELQMYNKEMGPRDQAGAQAPRQGPQGLAFSRPRMRMENF